jgi:cell wall-associated NlpC family hydrolase
VIAPWAQKYVGAPFKDGGRTLEGFDCYGLLSGVYRNEFHIEIPSYEGAYVSAHERDEIAALLEDRIPADAWVPVTGVPRVGDAVVFRVLNQPWHVGVMVSPTEFLHVEAAQGTATIERLDSFRWARRRHAVYRHPRLCA